MCILLDFYVFFTPSAAFCYLPSDILSGQMAPRSSCPLRVPKIPQKNNHDTSSGKPDIMVIFQKNTPVTYFSDYKALGPLRRKGVFALLFITDRSDRQSGTGTGKCAG